MPKTYNKKNEIGYTGTIIQEGQISDTEHNPDLKGIKWFKTVDKMRKSDATVRASLRALFLPILSANWFVEPASDDTSDKKIAEFVQDNLMNGMSRTWREFLQEALLYLPYGVMPFEEIYDLNAEGQIIIRKMGVRLPNTIYKWEMENGNNGITQQLSDGKKASIPIEKMTIFVNEKEGDNWWGNSVLRSAYPHWYYKTNIYKIDAMAHEKHGLGIPLVTMPPNASAEDEKKASAIAKNIRVHNQAFIKKTAGWIIEMMDQKSSTLKNPAWSIQHHNRQIVLNLLVQFLEIGSQGSSGSYAASNDQSDLFMLSEESMAVHIAECLNNYAIKRLVDFNFTVDKYPQLKCNKIKRIDFQKLAQGLASLGSSQFLTPNKKTEDWLRDQYDMPEIEEEERAEEELMEYLDEAENKQEKPVIMPNGLPVQKQTPDQLQADDKVKEDSNPLEQDPNAMIQKKTNKKLELQQLINEKKKWVLEQQKRGVKITPKQAAQIKIEILDLQTKLDKVELKDNKEQLKNPPEKTDIKDVKKKDPKPDNTKAIETMKRRVDNVLTAIEAELTQ